MTGLSTLLFEEAAELAASGLEGALLFLRVTVIEQRPALLQQVEDEFFHEGLNNKAKVTMRKSCGFRTFRVLELALYHSLGKLPEPELTHEFF